MKRSFCQEWFKKQEKIDRLTEENEGLKRKLRYRERRREEGFFGSSTPSSKVPVNPNSSQHKQRKKRGAKPGHKGAGRKGFDETQADDVVELRAQVGQHCPKCGGPLTNKGTKNRMVLESRPVKVQRVVYRLPQQYCARCHCTFAPTTACVLPKSLYGNQALASAAAMHYLHGIPMGRVCEQMGIEPGSLVQMFHRLARLFDAVP